MAGECVMSRVYVEYAGIGYNRPLPHRQGTKMINGWMVTGIFARINSAVFNLQ